VQTYSELLEGLKKIKKQGFVKTHRTGNTGIGKTLEDLLGIEENNFAGPDGELTELKSARKSAKSMLTLFTKSPLPKSANSTLLQKYGYASKKENGNKELHTTVNAISFNTLKGKPGFKIGIKTDRIEIIGQDKKESDVPYWDKETLKDRFETKYHQLLYVKADSRGKGEDEEFHFNEAYLLHGFDFNNFIKLLTEGTILVDIRIGQYSDGRPHDHGTGFRVFPDKLDLCFSNRQRVV